ncbi:NUDIX hydrolase [Paenibacillus alvei]|uniref:NUDIX hydrolase n=1 Tax=Paenibacillus alvei TaxID=44250 RepID=UPI00227E0AA1|nr:NUDIX domain-containing protein [Paenibacillus alvei]
MVAHKVAKEYVDTFTSEMEYTGIRSRDEVHAKGIWHQTFHCWLWKVENGEPILLFQRRHPQKLDYAGLLDITAAGHLEAGESPMDGIRELREELGLEIEFAQLTYSGVIPSSIEQEQIIDNEFCHVFLHEYKGDITDFRLQEDEVVSIVMLEAEQFRKLIAGEAQQISGEEFVPSSGESGIKVDLTIQDFVPSRAGYYEYVLEQIASLANQEVNQQN